MADAWERWQVKPRFAVLVGKGTLDYRNHRGYNDNLLGAVEWMMDNAGHAGKLKTVRMIARLEKGD